MAILSGCRRRRCGCGCCCYRCCNLVATTQVENLQLSYCSTRSCNSADLFITTQRGCPENGSLCDYRFYVQLQSSSSVVLHMHIAKVVRTYLETVSELPWNSMSEETYDIRRAQLQLDKDHYGLDKVPLLPFMLSTVLTAVWIRYCYYHYVIWYLITCSSSLDKVQLQYRTLRSVAGRLRRGRGGGGDLFCCIVLYVG